MEDLKAESLQEFEIDNWLEKRKNQFMEEIRLNHIPNLLKITDIFDKSEVKIEYDEIKEMIQRIFTL